MFTKITALTAALALSTVAMTGLAFATQPTAVDTTSDGNGSLCVTVTHEDARHTAQKGNCTTETTRAPVEAVSRYSARGSFEVLDLALAKATYHLKITNSKTGAVVYDKAATANAQGYSNVNWGEEYGRNQRDAMDSYRIELTINGSTLSYTSAPEDALKNTFPNQQDVGGEWIQWDAGTWTLIDGQLVWSAA